MSVRPLTKSEEYYASGLPLDFWAFTFGGLQGMLLYFRFTKTPITQNWLQGKYSFPLFALLVGGGFLGGAVFGRFAFGDAGLLKMEAKHR
jgi:hypothetical protein